MYVKILGDLQPTRTREEVLDRLQQPPIQCSLQPIPRSQGRPGHSVSPGITIRITIRTWQHVTVHSMWRHVTVHSMWQHVTVHMRTTREVVSVGTSL